MLNPKPAHNLHQSHEHHPCGGVRAEGTWHGRFRAQRAAQGTFFVSRHLANLRRGRDKNRQERIVLLSRTCITRRCRRWQRRAQRTLGLISRGRCRWQSAILPSFLTLKPSFRRSTHRSAPRMAPRRDSRGKDVVSEGFLPVPCAGTTEKVTSSSRENLPKSRHVTPSRRVCVSSSPSFLSPGCSERGVRVVAAGGALACMPLPVLPAGCRRPRISSTAATAAGPPPS